MQDKQACDKNWTERKSHRPSVHIILGEKSAIHFQNNVHLIPTATEQTEMHSWSWLHRCPVKPNSQQCSPHNYAAAFLPGSLGRGDWECMIVETGKSVLKIWHTEISLFVHHACVLKQARQVQKVMKNSFSSAPASGRHRTCHLHHFPLAPTWLIRVSQSSVKSLFSLLCKGERRVRNPLKCTGCVRFYSSLEPLGLRTYLSHK